MRRRLSEWVARASFFSELYALVGVHGHDGSIRSIAWARPPTLHSISGLVYRFWILDEINLFKSRFRECTDQFKNHSTSSMGLQTCSSSSS
jgi:hypothetical protein